MPGSLSSKLVGSTLEDINYIITFYIISLFVFPLCWETKRTFLLVYSIIISYGLFSFITYFNYFKLIPYLGGHVFYQKYPVSYLLIDDIFNFFIISSAGTASFFYRFSIHKYGLQAEKEKSLLVRELNYLRHQFNSQFAFNFFNYSYKNISNISQEVAESFNLFSEILRYTFQIKPEEKVSIKQEIDYIENFIRLQKLLSSKVYLIFKKNGKFINLNILPRILITYVENAFKHGIYNDPNFPIKIFLKVNTNIVTFIVINKINKNKKIKSTHSGLENAKQILDLFYTDNYELIKEENEDLFKIELNIKT